MKQEQGLVLDVRGDVAHVRVGRHGECVSCGACAGAQNVTVDALNRLGARPGQRVMFEMKESHVLTGAFVVFVMPLLIAAIGGAVGGWLGAWEGMPMAIGAAAGFAASLPAVRMFDRRAAGNSSLLPVIVEILQ